MPTLDPDCCPTLYWCNGAGVVTSSASRPGDGWSGPWRNLDDALAGCPTAPTIDVPCAALTFTFDGELNWSAVNPTGCAASASVAGATQPAPNVSYPLCTGASCVAPTLTWVSGCGWPGGPGGATASLIVYWCIAPGDCTLVTCTIVGSFTASPASPNIRPEPYANLLDGTWSYTGGVTGFTATKTFASSTTDFRIAAPFPVVSIRCRDISTSTVYATADLWLGGTI